MQLTTVLRQLRLLLVLAVLSVSCHAGSVALLGARDLATVHTVTSTTYTTLLSITNMFAEPGQLLVFAGGRTYTPAGVPTEPYELWTAFKLTGSVQTTSVFFHDVLTNKVNYAMQSLTCADVLSVGPGLMTIDLAVRQRVAVSGIVLMDNVVLNALFIPDSGTSVSCIVARVPGTTVFSPTNVWQDVIATNFNLLAGRYLVVGAAAVANSTPNEQADAEMRLLIAGQHEPELEFQLFDTGGDGTDRGVVMHRGGDINDVVVTNAALQIKTDELLKQPVGIYHAMLAVIHDQLWQEDWTVAGTPGGQIWYWSGATTALPPEELNFDMPYNTLHLSCFTLGTTAVQARCQAQLSLNESVAGAALRQDEIARGINLPQYFPGQLSAYWEAPMGSNRFNTTFANAPLTPQMPLFRDSGWQTVIGVPVPEPLGVVPLLLLAWCRDRHA